jgi:hypothetical protein
MNGDELVALGVGLEDNYLLQYDFLLTGYIGITNILYTKYITLY